EIGPEVCDVLVVLYADKCHARARHFLHRRAEIFGESFLAPGDTTSFAGWGVVETTGRAALGAIAAVPDRAGPRADRPYDSSSPPTSWLPPLAVRTRWPATRPAEPTS